VTAAPLLPAGRPRVIEIVNITEDSLADGEMHGENKTRGRTSLGSNVSRDEACGVTYQVYRVAPP
jgi:hypothetical protein